MRPKLERSFWQSFDYAEQYGRFYWYAMNRGPDEPPHNTLSIEGSATTKDGCMEEILRFFAGAK